MKNETTIPPGYKDTELGIIPEDWEVGELKTLARVNGRIGFRGYTTKDLVKVGEGALVLGGKHINKNCLDLTDPDFISWEKYYESPEIMVHQKDILLAQRGTIGKVAIIDTFIGEATINPSLVLLNGFKSSPKYLYYSLLSNQLQRQMLQTNSITSIPMISQTQIESLLLIVPSKEEQERIAEVLSDVDELIATIENAIEKKRAIKAGAMQQLLTGKTRLPGFSAPWIEKTLGEIGIFLKGSGISKEQSNTGDIPAVRYGELYVNHHEYIKSFSSFISQDLTKSAVRIQKGDILFTASGETKEEIAKSVSFIDDYEAYAGGDLIILRPQIDLDPMFMGYLTNAKFVREQKASLGQGDSVVHITSTAIRAISLSLPSIDEQRAIAEVLSDMDAEIEALEAKREKLIQIKQGMMQELLTGKTRLL